MALSWMLYLATIFHSIKNISETISIIYFIVLAGLTFFWMVTHGEYEERSHKFISGTIKKYTSKIWIAIICLLIAVLTPSKETMYLMIGSNYLQNGDIPSQVSDIINYKLKDILAELKKEDK